ELNERSTQAPESERNSLASVKRGQPQRERRKSERESGELTL
ncbi:unnamed protein product, partial [Arabidopsis thaliana]